MEDGRVPSQAPTSAKPDEDDKKEMAKSNSKPELNDGTASKPTPAPRPVTTTGRRTEVKKDVKKDT